MSIPPTETQLVKAEIEAYLFRQAFVELAVAFARRDRKGFEGTASSVRAIIDGMSLGKFLPPAHVEAGALDIQLLRESGQRDAIMKLDSAIRQVLKRLG